jgi:hypothetical protein
MAQSQTLFPDYWLPQPNLPLDEDQRRACDALLAAALAQGAAQFVDYTMSIPKWRFLCYVAEEHSLALHGSSNGSIQRFEPRQPHDLTEFGAQNAVYAASDGIWPMYFAIVDRIKSPSVINACIQVEEADGSLGRPHYFFSISKDAVALQPYHTGVVYLLPGETFMRQPSAETGQLRVHVAQLASLQAVDPLAKILVEPEDFPFLAQMRTHDDARLELYAEAMMKGLPWPDPV